MPLSLSENLRKGARQLMAKELVSPDARARVSRYLKGRVAEMSASGQGSPIYRMFVNGSESNDLSRIVFGSTQIVLKFDLLSGVARFMLAYAKEVSARASGAYANAWFLAVNGVPLTDLSRPIPPGSQVMLTNFAPFARRREEENRVGRSGRLTAHPHPERVITELVRREVKTRFPSVDVSRTYVLLPSPPSGMAGNWQVPYRLKRGAHKGEEVLYPAVLISGR